MTITVKLADGRILQFPDGTAQSVIQGVVNGMIGQKAEAQTPQENVIATTPNGGRVVKMANGTMSYADKGYATTDQATIDKIMAGEDVTMLDPMGFKNDSVNAASSGIKPGAGMSALSGFVSGGTMGWGDELIGAVAGNKVRDGVRALNTAARRDYPVTEIGGEIAGGITALAPVASVATVARAMSPLGKMLYGMLVGGAAGGTQGAIQGAGDANSGARLSGAKSGGAFGAGLGAVGGAIAPALGAGVAAIFNKFKKSDVAQIARSFGVNSNAATAIKNALEADDFAKAADEMKKAGDEAMLADAGPASGQLLDTAAQSGGASNRVAQTAVRDRANKAYAKLTETMDNVLGTPEGVRGAAADISKRTAGEREKAYNTAYAAAIDYSSPEGLALESAMRSVPPATLQSAITTANNAMRASGTRNKQIMAVIGKNGEVKFVEMPNVQQLDEIKKALGNNAAEMVDRFGRQTSEGRMNAKLATRLRDAINSAVPEYGAATRLGGDKIAEDRALALGRDMLKSSMTREDVKMAIEGASVEALSAAKIGLRGAIDDALANVRASVSNPNVDIKEAQKLIGDLSTRAAREKMRLVLGGDADKIIQEIDIAAKQLYLNGVVSRGSQTYGRQVSREAVLSGGDTALNALLSGEPVNASKRVIQFLTARTPADRTAKEMETWAQIADVLTSKKGTDAANALAIVRAAAAGQPVTQAQAELVARLVTGGTVIPAQQAGSKYLDRRVNEPQ